MPLEPSLAAESGVLDASERRGGVRHDPLVETDHARFDPLADADRTIQVAGVDVGDEPYSVRFGRQRAASCSRRSGDRGDGPEDLLTQQPGVGGHVDDDVGS